MHKLPCFLALLLVCSPSARSDEAAQGWPQWRGPLSSGAAVSAHPPIKWSESENVRWKVDVPGVGSSTPIVLGDRVYVATAVKTDRVQESQAQQQQESENKASENTTASTQPPAAEIQRGAPQRAPRGGGRFRRGGFGSGPAPTHFYDFMVIAYAKDSGAEVWKTTLTSQVPHEAGHNTNTFASSSPITDGERLYVSFGSRGLYALDFGGKPLWHKDLGKMQTRAQFGEGSSPAVHAGKLVVPFDHEGESFIVALDASSGDELWRQSRDERTTWSTPLITEFEGRTQVVTNGSTRVRSYDLATGELIWQCGGQAGNPIPTPVRYGDDVIVMTGYRGYVIYSIPLSATGDITDTDVPTWTAGEAAPYVSSPLLYDDQLYFVKSNSGIFVSRHAKTGEEIIEPTRLPDISSVYASPVGAAGLVYVTGRDGTTVVLKHGAEFEVVATNRLEAEIDASAAVVDETILLRSKTHLYCIANDATAAAIDRETDPR